MHIIHTLRAKVLIVDNVHFVMGCTKVTIKIE
jgi:hypothetical protein